MAFKLPKFKLPAGKKMATEVPISLEPSNDDLLPATSMGLPSPSKAGKRAFRLPLIGKKPFAQQIRILGFMVFFLLACLAVVVYLDVKLASNGTARVEVTGNTLMHSQRLAKAVPPAVAGNPPAFEQLKDSRDTIEANLERLEKGSKPEDERKFDKPSEEIQEEIKKIREEWGRTQKNATTVLEQQAILTTFGATITRINAQNPVLLELTEQIANQKLQIGAPAREIATSSQLVMLTQRLAKNANELLSGEGVNPETAFLLGKDTNTFRDMLDGLLNGSESLRLTAAKDDETREKLGQLKEAFDNFQKSVQNILANLQKIVAAKQAQQAVFQDNEQLRGLFDGLQLSFNRELDKRTTNFELMALLGLLLLLTLAAMAVAFAADNGVRAEDAERRQLLAERQEQDAKSTNDQNQAAILRLMNELQEVADGNLTVQATVTEDITGAIADSVNYTVEELRTLVARINRTAEQVTDATNKAQDQSSKLLTAATEQSREIKQTGESVLRMASAINDVSSNAAESANVARKSLAAAEDGQRAVQNAIAGMDGIRDQIQETSKRIKRLGESSQEIGEIIELISDITEQTNVLALNAAIQAASAGEAGRGFTVVAEEVQRLADRSGEAAKQIGALVRTIQTDTQDAVAAMEKSTAGVVEGAKLSDAAGQSLTNIGSVSKQLAELIENISHATSSEASNANDVARSIEHILSVNEQTSTNTQQTAAEIKQLAALALELKSSVSRFRVS